jgi:four helix bundle protein
MPNAGSFKELIVWQRALSFAKDIYRVTRKLPKSEEYALSSQLRRAAVSIASNIAEGSKRGTRKDFVQFLRIADGSAAEVETQILIASDIYPQEPWTAIATEINEIQRMLKSLIRSIV